MPTETGSAIVWEGPSAWDGSPLAVVVTRVDRASTNGKTGPMAQAFVIPTDIRPSESIRTAGADAGQCGDCPLSRSRGGACYVRVEQSPDSVARAYHRGAYPRVSPVAMRDRLEALGRRLRIGAYGDPGMVPAHVWDALGAVPHTGYTHRWRDTGAHLRGVCMASADSSADRAEARAAGFRTFRVVAALADLEPGEILCPTDPSNPRTRRDGSPVTCSTCGLCDGKRGPNDRRADVAILAHDGSAKRHPALRALPMLAAAR